MVNGPDRIFIEKDGRLTQWQGRFESPARLLDVIQQIAAGCNRVVNEASPILDARLSDGSRVNVVLSPVALNGPAMTIRRFPEEGMTLDRLVALGSITEECKSFLELLVKCRYLSLIHIFRSPHRSRIRSTGKRSVIPPHLELSAMFIR